MRGRSSDLRGEKAGLGITVRRKIDLKDFYETITRFLLNKAYKRKDDTLITSPRNREYYFGFCKRPSSPSLCNSIYKREIHVPHLFRRLIIEGIVLPVLIPLGHFFFYKKLQPYSLVVSTVVLSTIGFLRVLFPEIFVDEIVDVAGSSKKSGVHIGDRLISVNGNSSKSSLKSLRELLDGGKVGESVKIAVSRKFNENNTSSSILLTFDVIRDYVSMVQVKRMLLSNGIGYLNIKEFSERTFVDTVEAIDLLRSEAKLKNDKLSGIIIDLRGNLGGTLSSALDIAAIFLKRGKVLMKVFNILSFFLLS
jgi:hypothetical protein